MIEIKLDPNRKIIHKVTSVTGDNVEELVAEYQNGVKQDVLSNQGIVKLSI